MNNALLKFRNYLSYRDERCQSEFKKEYFKLNNNLEPHLNKSNKRLLLASIIGSLSTIIIFLKITNIILIILKILLSLILIIVSFGKSNIIVNTFYFYLISIIVGGTIYLFDLNKNLYFNYLIKFNVFKLFLRF